MRFKCPECEHNTDNENIFAKDINVPSKEQIIIDGVDVSGCEYLKYDKIGCDIDESYCQFQDCYFKQLQKEKFENLNNRQMVESAENLIYENSELYKNLKEKEQECEKYKKLAADFKDVNKQLGYKYLTIKDECEELKEKYEEVKEDRYNLNMEMYVLDRYRKALEEIEKATKINCEEICGRKFEDCNDTSCFSAELLNIINKAKGEGNV